jgi:hypothetical protein
LVKEFFSLATEVRGVNLLPMLGIGCSALRGDLSLRRAGPAEDEVFEVFEEKDEHQAQQGPYSFPCTSTHSLENYPRVGFLGLNEGTFFFFGWESCRS